MVYLTMYFKHYFIDSDNIVYEAPDDLSTSDERVYSEEVNRHGAFKDNSNVNSGLSMAFCYLKTLTLNDYRAAINN